MPTLLSLLAVMFLLSVPCQAEEVNHHAATLGLSGDWQVKLDPKKEGASASWFAAPLVGGVKVRLPGSLDDAGLGATNAKLQEVSVASSDAKRDANYGSVKADKMDYAGPSRRHSFTGAAWYQREITVPQEWNGKRVTLFLERCRWTTSVWLGDRFIGSQDSLIAPHTYDFGVAVPPGKHRLTLCVDNTVKYDLGLFVSALFGGTPGNLNGVVGRIGLDATPTVWLEDVQVYPDVDSMTAKVAVKIGNASGKPGTGILIVGAQSTQAAWSENGGRAEVTVDMKGAKLWDEFSPNMQEIKVSLNGQSRTVRFGMRKFGVNANHQFTLNGRPLFLRGTLECSIWPLTGYPPTDTAAWARIYQIMKSHGLNHIRFHSWTPPEAAFIAADEAGIIVQTECPQANVVVEKVPVRLRFIEAEARRIIATYGNHPSFCMMTMGNELYGKATPIQKLAAEIAKLDPRRLVSTGSSDFNRKDSRGHGDFFITHEPRGVKAPGTAHDFRSAIAKDVCPRLFHEVGQWTFFPDFRLIEKYTGVFRLRNFEIIRDHLKKQGMLDLAPMFCKATGKQALLLYKEEIEVTLRTPNAGGVQLLDLHDYPMQGTALIGPLDEFWESKGLITPEAYRRFCNSTVPLLRLPKRVYTSDETLQADSEIAHFGPTDLKAATPKWKITDAEGATVAAGAFAAIDLPTGKLSPMGSIETTLSSVKAPAKLTVEVSVEGFSNDWEIWVYPATTTPEQPVNVTVCTAWPEASAALRAGKNVVLFPAQVNPAKMLPGKFLPVFWSAVWFPNQKPNTMGLLCDDKHLAFARFPTDIHSNWQWWNLIDHSSSIILDDTPAGYRPIVQVVDNFTRNHKLGVIFEAQVGTGKLLVCAIDLPKHADKMPEARQLLHSLYTYAGAQAFQPKDTLDEKHLAGLFPVIP